MPVTSKTMRLLRQMNVEVNSTVDAQTRTLVAAWARAWDEVSDELGQAILDIAAAGDGVTATQIRRSQKIASSMASVAGQLDKLAFDSSVLITDSLGQVVSASMNAQVALTGSQLPRTGPSWAFTTVDDRYVEAIVRRSAQQISALHYPLSNNAQDAVRRSLVRGASSARHPTRIARDMIRRTEGAFNGGLSRALTIARTEVLDAHRAAAQAWQQANSASLAGWEWISNLDERTCGSCFVQHGTRHPIDEFGPADHQNGRCSRLPVTLSWRELGIDLDEPAGLQLPDGRSVFDAFSVADQKAILGPGRWQALQDGAPWESFSAVRTTAGWRDSYGVPRLADMGR